MKRSDHQLIQRAFDGSLAPAEFDSLQERMRNEPELAQLYHDYALLHHSLSEEFEGKRMIGRPLPQPVARPFPLAATLAAAAAVVITGFLVWLFLPDPKSQAPLPTVAQVTLSDDATWSIDGNPPTVASPTIAPGERLDLACGHARLEIPSGATALIRGPAALVYHSAGRLELEHGHGRFRDDDPRSQLVVEAATLIAVDLGTEFAVTSRPDGNDELHVFEGHVQLRRHGSDDGPVLSAGDAAVVDSSGKIDRVTAQPEQFPIELPRSGRLLMDRFGTDTSSTLDGRRPVFGPSSWILADGSVRLADGKLEGSDFTAFIAMSEAPGPDKAVLLATLELSTPSSGDFHTPGWAGLSFYRGDTEHLFFGDSFGPDSTWSLDVKQGKVPVLPASPVTGARTVTLRYDFRTGETSLHEGSIPLGPAFVKDRLPPGLAFDRVRLGTSPDATIAVRSIDVRAMER